MQVGLSTQKTVTTTQYNPTQQADVARSNAINGLIAIALPLVVIGAILAYQKHKSTVLQRRIQRLNRLWQLDTSKNLS